MALYLIINEASGLTECVVEGENTRTRASRIRDQMNEAAGRTEQRHDGLRVTYRSAKAEDELSAEQIAALEASLEREGAPPE